MAEHNGMGATWGLLILVSPFLPLTPSPEEVGRRIARHVFAEELRGLGRAVGPRPDEQTHVFWRGDTLICSQQFADRLARAGEPDA